MSGGSSFILRILHAEWRVCALEDDCTVRITRQGQGRGARPRLWTVSDVSRVIYGKNHQEQVRNRPGD